MSNEIIKGWITWPDNARDEWFHCQLVLENGWPIYGHICSHPAFALGDLWENRQERKADWATRKLTLEIVAQVPHSELPEHILENNKNESYVAWIDKHFPELTSAPASTRETGSA